MGTDLVRDALGMQNLKLRPFVDPQKSLAAKISLIITFQPISSLSITTVVMTKGYTKITEAVNFSVCHFYVRQLC